jgi:hypothetical protein
MVFKKLVSGLQEKLSAASSAIKDIIKENNQYLEAELEVAKESQEAVLALQSYADKETPSLEAAITAYANTLEGIESARKEKVVALREKFIGPLEALLDGFVTRQTEIKEAEDAKKTLEKAESKLAKLKSKPKEKLKAGQLEGAKTAVKEGQASVEKEEADVKVANETFAKQKLETMQQILTSMHDIEKSYHEKALQLFGAVKEKAAEIKVEEEAKIEEIVNLAAISEDKEEE